MPVRLNLTNAFANDEGLHIPASHPRSRFLWVLVPPDQLERLEEVVREAQAAKVSGSRTLEPTP